MKPNLAVPSSPQGPLVWPAISPTICFFFFPSMVYFLFKRCRRKAEVEDHAAELFRLKYIALVTAICLFGCAMYYFFHTTRIRTTSAPARDEEEEYKVAIFPIFGSLPYQFWTQKPTNRSKRTKRTSTTLFGRVDDYLPSDVLPRYTIPTYLAT